MLSHAVLCMFVLPALISAACYTPDGSLSNDVPCNPSAATSLCCTAGFYCLSNFLCSTDAWYKKGSDKFIRGTCTDKTWADPACGNHCIKENKSGGEWVMRCDGGSDTESPTWCCANDKCCDGSGEKFHMGNGTLLAVAKEVKTESSTARPTTQTTSALTTPIASTTTISQTTDVAPPHATSTGHSSNNIAIGAGVGVGVGVIIIAAAGIWIWLRRRRQAAKGQGEKSQAKEPEAVQQWHPQELEGKQSTEKRQHGIETGYANGLAELPAS